jgi:serine/threonine-protein kinase
MAAVMGIILANGWASQAQLDRLKGVATESKQLIRALIEQNIMPVDAAGQLDLLVQQQAQLPNFRLLKKLGAGGMGTVYLAEHLASGGQVALKVISSRLVGDTEFLNRFHRETKALVGLRHPHLANIIESGTQGTTHYLAMENVNGPSLAGMLKEYRALPEHYVLNLVHQLADALNYVYQKAGLVHRDIKPENVLVERVPNAQELFPETDQAKLIDFGLVKTTNDDEHLTQTGMTIGTPLYMSPEQVRGEKLDCRSDIYGLGATTFHLLTGMPPFRGSSPGAIMSAHLTQPTPDPGTLVPGLSPQVRRLVMTAMAKGTEERYVTFDALMKACSECLEQAREKHGGSIKLLRKPLVIHNKKPALAGHDGAAPAAPVQPASERIQRKHAEKKLVDVDLPDIAGAAHPAAHASVREQAQGQPAASSQRAPAAAPARQPGTAPSARVPASSGRGPAAKGAAGHQPSDGPAGGTATDALVRAHTDKIRGKRELPKTPPAPAPDLSHSAAFAEDPRDSAGTGLVPWLILGFAVIIAVAYGIWRVRGG